MVLLLFEILTKTYISIEVSSNEKPKQCQNMI